MPGITKGSTVGLPVKQGRVREFTAQRRQMMSLAEQVRQREAEVESRLAHVGHLVIEQHQLAVMNEHILRAVVAVNKRILAGAGGGDQRGVEGGSFGNLRAGVVVIGL